MFAWDFVRHVIELLFLRFLSAIHLHIILSLFRHYSIHFLILDAMNIEGKTVWQHAVGDWGHEHETVCHLVVPLLRILGWTPQKMASKPLFVVGRFSS